MLGLTQAGATLGGLTGFCGFLWVFVVFGVFVAVCRVHVIFFGLLVLGFRVFGFWGSRVF